MKYPLIASLIALSNTATTLVNDLHQADVDGVTLEMTKNTPLIAKLLDDDWVVIVKADDYTMHFGPENSGKLPVFDKTLVEAIEPLTSFMFEDESESFINEIGTVPQRIKDIAEHRKALIGDPDEIQKQQIIAMIISRWFIVLRWLEEVKAIGVDETVMFTPTFDLKDDLTLIIENNRLSAQVSLTDGQVAIDGTALSAKRYIELSLKDEGRDDILYYVCAALESISGLSKDLIKLV